MFIRRASFSAFPATARKTSADVSAAQLPGLIFTLKTCSQGKVENKRLDCQSAGKAERAGKAKWAVGLNKPLK